MKLKIKLMLTCPILSTVKTTVVKPHVFNKYVFLVQYMPEITGK